MDYGFINTIVNTFDLGLAGQLIPLGIVTLSVIMITRNTRHMSLIALPIAIGYTRLGLNINFIIIAALAILWITTLVGAHIIDRDWETHMSCVSCYHYY